MAISDWPVEQRPRERLIHSGAQALSDAELLAVFLRVGVRGKSAVELGHDMLTHFGSLQGLLAASRQQFSQINGLGDAKFAQLQAALELARRSLHEELRRGDPLSSPEAVKRYLQLRIGNLPYESFTVLFLDAQNRLISLQEMFRGSLCQASVYPREIVKAALEHNAASLILAHNHPSGYARPSQADIRLTQTIKQSLALVDMRVLDHVIVTQTDAYSLAEHEQL